MSEPLDCTGWPKRVVDALSAMSVRTWDDLAATPAHVLLTHKGFGRDSLEFVMSELAERGLLPRPTPPPPREKPNVEDCRSGVYFVACGEFIKIGHTSDLANRLRNAGTFTPHKLTLEHFIACDTAAEAFALETHYHTRFEALWHRGEWFRLEGELEAYLAAPDV